MNPLYIWVEVLCQSIQLNIAHEQYFFCRSEEEPKKRTLKVLDEKIFLKSYGKEIRQIAIAGMAK